MSDEKKLNSLEFMDAVSKLQNELENLKKERKNFNNTNTTFLENYNWKGTSKDYYSSQVAEACDKAFEKLNDQLSQSILDLIDTSKTVNQWDRESAQNFQK